MIIHISVIVLIAAIYVALSEQSQWFTSLKFYLENIRTSCDQSVHTAIGAPQKDWNLLYHLGGNGPWLPKVDGVVEGGYSPPENCRVDQVHVIARHNERYPTYRATKGMVDLHNRLRDHQDKLQGDLAFFRNWTFFMSDDYEYEAGQLIPTGPFAGTLGAFKTGIALRTRYAKLRDVAIFRNHTNFWAADSPRVVDTARYFATGFYGLDWKDGMANLHVVPETDDLGADTLTTGTTCTAYQSDPDEGRQKGLTKLEEWQNIYLPPIIQRFEEQNPGLNLSIQEAWTMQELCGFEVLARGNSPWCELFNYTEWESFAYARSLLHYYRSGPGNKYSAARAFPFINATTNLLSSGPFAGTLFFSFVHDGDINPLLTFLDLFPNLPSPPAPFTATTSPNHTASNNTWDSSTLTPMGARLTLERLSCPAVYCRSNAPLYPNHVYCDKAVEEKYVRVLINDGVVAMPGCDGGPGKSCPLAEFEKRVMLRGWEVGEFGRVCGLEDGREKKVKFLHQ